MGLQIHFLLALEDFVQLHTDLWWSNCVCATHRRGFRGWRNPFTLSCLLSSPEQINAKLQEELVVQDNKNCCVEHMHYVEIGRQFCIDLWYTMLLLLQNQTSGNGGLNFGHNTKQVAELLTMTQSFMREQKVIQVTNCIYKTFLFNARHYMIIFCKILSDS